MIPSLYFILDFVNLGHAIFKLSSLVIRSVFIRDRTFMKGGGGGANMGRVIIFCVTQEGACVFPATFLEGILKLCK